VLLQLTLLDCCKSKVDQRKGWEGQVPWKQVKVKVDKAAEEQRG